MGQRKRIKNVIIAIVSSTCVASAALAVTLTGDPAADGWTLHGNSQALGIWGAQSQATNFDLYTTSFVLSSTDSVSGTDRGNTAASLHLGSFQDGDRIFAIGVKWGGGQVGYSTAFVKVDPNHTGSFQPASTLGGTDGRVSGATDGGNGTFQANFVGYKTNRAFSYYIVYTPAGNATTPYGTNFLNYLATPTSAGPFHIALPMRAFGIASTPPDWSSFEILFDEDAQQRAGYGEGTFNLFNGWNFVFTAGNASGQYTDTVVTNVNARVLAIPALSKSGLAFLALLLALGGGVFLAARRH